MEREELRNENGEIMEEEEWEVEAGIEDDMEDAIMAHEDEDEGMMNTIEQTYWRHTKGRVVGKK